MTQQHGFLLGIEGDGVAPAAIGFSARADKGPPPSGQILRDGGMGEGHLLIVGASGAGKSACFAIPNLLACDENSVIAIDIKGELYNVTQRHRRSLGPVLAIDPFGLLPKPERGAFNPLSSLSVKHGDFEDGLFSLVTMLCEGAGGSRNGISDAQFWNESAGIVISGLLAFTLSSEKREHHHLGRAYQLFSADDVVYALARLLDEHPQTHALARANIGKFLSLPEVTRGGVLSTVVQHLRILSSQNVRDSLSRNSLPPRTIEKADKPYTIYLVFPPDRLKSHAALLRVYLTSLMQMMTRRKNRPAHPTLVLADEAAQLGNVPALVSMTTLGRGYGVRIAWLLQSLTQLQVTYQGEFRAIVENCDTLAMGPMKSFSMARSLSEAAFGDVSADTLFALKRQEVMVSMAGEKSRTIRKLDYRHHPLFAGRFDTNPLYAHAR
jgi:type IV secretion system protein VirD4